MQSYIAKVYTSANPDFVETIALPAGDIDGAGVCGLLADTMHDCIAREAFIDASNGESYVERSDGCGGNSAMAFMVYDAPRCYRDTDLRVSEDCVTGECDCESDAYLITLDPTE